jgi:hypothetical protein
MASLWVFLFEKRTETGGRGERAVPGSRQPGAQARIGEAAHDGVNPRVLGGPEPSNRCGMDFEQLCDAGRGGRVEEPIAGLNDEPSSGTKPR